MTLERSFAEYLSHMHNRKPAASHVHLFEYHVPQEKDNARICCLNDIQPIIKW